MELAEVEYVNVLQETNQAILFEFPSGKCWIPKSQITDKQEHAYDSETGKQPGHIEIPEWVAIEKDLV